MTEDKLDLILGVVSENRDVAQQRLKELKYSIDELSRKLDTVEDHVEREVKECNRDIRSMLKKDYASNDQIKVILNDHAIGIKESLLIEIKRYAVFTGTFLGVLAVVYTFVFGTQPVLHNGNSHTHPSIQVQQSSGSK